MFVLDWENKLKIHSFSSFSIPNTFLTNYEGELVKLFIHISLYACMLYILYIEIFSNFNFISMKYAL